MSQMTASPEPSLKSLRVLVACEYSGRVRDAFIRAGHDAMSCDLEETESPGPHYRGDVRDVLGDPWGLIVAHPDCSRITNAGVRWLDRDIERWKEMWEACEFFRIFLAHKCPRIAVENPIPHKYSLRWIGQRHSQVVQPWMFGHPERKATCLWLKGLPKLVPTNNVKHLMAGMPRKETDRCHYASPGPERWKDRSRTYNGIADAMATQWSAYLQTSQIGVAA